MYLIKSLCSSFEYPCPCIMRICLINVDFPDSPVPSSSSLSSRLCCCFCFLINRVMARSTARRFFSSSEMQQFHESNSAILKCSSQAFTHCPRHNHKNNYTPIPPYTFHHSRDFSVLKGRKWSNRGDYKDEQFVTFEKDVLDNF